MQIKYTNLGWQIVYTPNQFINKAMWGKPVTNRVFESWADASAYIDSL